MGKRKVQCRDGQTESEMAELSENGAGAGKTLENGVKQRDFRKTELRVKFHGEGCLPVYSGSESGQPTLL